MKHIALLLAVLMVVSSANAAITVGLKDTMRGGDLGNFRKIEIEDGTMDWDDGDYDRTVDPMANAKGTPKKNAIATSYSNVAGPEWGAYMEVLIGVQNFFDLLPNGLITGPEDILSVDMVLYQGGPTGGEELGIYRVTTPWLSVGEDNGEAVSAVRRMAGPGGEDGPWWVADAGKADPGGTDPDYSAFTGFSPADYTTEHAQYITLCANAAHPDGLNGQTGYTVDITEIVRDWYTEGNEGLCIVMLNEYWNHADAPYLRDSEISTSWNTKVNGGERATEFIVTYIPEPATLSLLALGGLALIRRRRK